MTIQPFSVQTTKASSSGDQPTNSGTNNNLNSATGPFLQMLIAELQSQDPTSPLDPSQMTQQIVSLNQLDQLIQIRQLLQPATTN